MQKASSLSAFLTSRRESLTIAELNQLKIGDYVVHIDHGVGRFGGLVRSVENGKEQEFEYLDVIEYEGKEYLFLLPLEDENAEVVILEIEPVDEENENYLAVEDEAILDAVYGIFKERYKDVLNFAD